jgi:signal transduction histidine kinase
MVDELPIVITIASGLISLAIGLYVYLEGRDRLVNRLLLLIAVFLALWALGEAMTMASSELGQKIFWTKFQGIGEMLLVPTYLMLALYFPRPKRPLRDRRKAAAIVTALYAPWLVGLLLLYTTGFFYSEYFAIEGGQGINVVRTPAFWFLTAIGFSEIIAAIAIFLRERSRSASAVSRKGLLILALAPMPMLIANVIQNFELNRYVTTPQASLIFVLMLAYGILRYGLFIDIRLITRNALVHTMVITANLTLFTLLCAFYVYGLNLGLEWATYVLFVLTGIPFMLAYNAELSWAKKAAERYLYGREVEESRLLLELGRSIRTVSNLGELAESVVGKVRDSMGLAACGLLLKEDGAYRVIGYSANPNHPAAKFSEVITKGVVVRKAESFYGAEDREGRFSGYWKMGDMISRGDYEMIRIGFGLMRIIQRGKVEEYYWREEREGEFISVPLVVGGEEMGLLMLGGRKGRIRFSLEELDLIGTLSTQVAISLLNSKLLQELLDKSARLVSLIKSSNTAQEEERIRISRELHDGLAPYFLDLIFRLEVLEAKMAGEPSLAELKEMARNGLRDLRRVIGDLRPSSLDILGLEKSLSTYLERFAAENGLQVEFGTWGDLGTLDSLAEVTIFRIAQEALSNIARHAYAGKVSFSLGGDNGCAEMVVEDDGVGFMEREVRERMLTGECLGMKGMRERAELMQGDLLIDSRPGSGTRIKLTIPMPMV